MGHRFRYDVKCFVCVLRARLDFQMDSPLTETIQYKSAVIHQTGNVFSIFESDAATGRKAARYCFIGGAAACMFMTAMSEVAFGVFLAIFFAGIGAFILKVSKTSRLVEIDLKGGQIRETTIDQGRETVTVLALDPFSEIELAFWETAQSIAENTSDETTMYRVLLRRAFTKDLVSEKAKHLKPALQAGAMAETLVAATVAGAKSNYLSVGTAPTTDRGEAEGLALALQGFLSSIKHLPIDERPHAALFPNPSGHCQGLQITTNRG